MIRFITLGDILVFIGFISISLIIRAVELRHIKKLELKWKKLNDRVGSL